MQKYDLVRYAKVIGVTISVVVVYAYIWRLSKVVGVFLFLGIICAFVYLGLDWEYLKTYFFADPNAY